MVKEIRKLGIPDYIGIQTEKAQFWGKPEQGSVQTEDVEGFNTFIERYKAGLAIEKAATESLK